jgi:hypothetical protein
MFSAIRAVRREKNNRMSLSKSAFYRVYAFSSDTDIIFAEDKGSESFLLRIAGRRGMAFTKSDHV